MEKSDNDVIGIPITEEDLRIWINSQFEAHHEAEEKAVWAKDAWRMKKDLADDRAARQKLPKLVKRY